MSHKTILIVGVGATCLLFESLQAIAKEAGFTLIEAKEAPGDPAPVQPSPEYIFALVDTRRPSLAELAQFLKRENLSSRQLKRMHRNKRGVPRDIKTKSRVTAMKKKSRR